MFEIGQYPNRLEQNGFPFYLFGLKSSSQVIHPDTKKLLVGVGRYNKKKRHFSPNFSPV